MRELTDDEIAQVFGGAMSQETKTIFTIALICPAFAAVVALGYYANNQC